GDPAAAPVAVSAAPPGSPGCSRPISAGRSPGCCQPPSWPWRPWCGCHRRAPRTGRARAAALMWGGWLLVTGLVFSYMSGIIHPYYTVALAPAIGALVGIGSVELWRVRHTWFACAVLAAGLLITAIWAWALLDRSPGWFPWLRVVIVIAGAAAGLILARRAFRPAAGWRRTVLAAAPAPLALIAGLGGPLAYSM